MRGKTWLNCFPLSGNKQHKQRNHAAVVCQSTSSQFYVRLVKLKEINCMHWCICDDNTALSYFSRGFAWGLCLNWYSVKKETFLIHLFLLINEVKHADRPEHTCWGRSCWTNDGMNENVPNEMLQTWGHVRLNMQDNRRECSFWHGLLEKKWGRIQSQHILTLIKISICLHSEIF